MSLLDDLQKDVSTTWDNITSAGVPAVIAGAESYAATQLQTAAQQNQATSAKAVQQAVASGGPSSGLMASIEGVFGNIASGQVVKQYGAWIIIGGIVAIIVIKKVL